MFRQIAPLAIAVFTGLYLWLTAPIIARERPGIGPLFFSNAVRILVIVQLAAGVVNILLNVPVWMQLVHLLLADLMWIVVVLLGVSALAEPVTAAQPATLELDPQ